MQKQTHHSRILKLLQSGKWICSTKFEYMRDARKRISELNHAGYLIEGMPCDIHIHDSRIFMRKLVRKPKAINTIK